MTSLTNSLSDIPTSWAARPRSAFSSSDMRVLISAVSFPNDEDAPEREKTTSSYICGPFGADLALLARGLRHEDLRPDNLQEHEAGSGDAVLSPLRNGAYRHVAELRNYGAPAKRINKLVRVHAGDLSALRAEGASTLRGQSFSVLNMSTLYERLLEICRDQGIERPIGRDIERLAGISSGRVTQIKQEREAARPGDETIARLSRLGYLVDWIREGKGPKRAADALLPSSNIAPKRDALESSAPKKIGIPELDGVIEAVLASHGWTLDDYLRERRTGSGVKQRWLDADEPGSVSDRAKKRSRH